MSITGQEKSAQQFVLAFMHSTAAYRCHAEGCSAAKDNPTARNAISIFPERFGSVQECRAFADADESEKAGAKTKANFRVCKCAKAGALDADFRAALMAIRDYKPSDGGKNGATWAAEMREIARKVLERKA